MKKVILIFYLFATTTCIAQGISEELKNQFITNIKKAIQAKSFSAYEELHYWEEGKIYPRSDSKEGFDWMINEIELSTNTTTYSYEPLFEPEIYTHIRNGFQYTYPLKPVGYIKISLHDEGNQSFLMSYGIKNERLYLTKMAKQKIDWDGPPDTNQFNIIIRPTGSAKTRDFKVDYAYNASGVSIQRYSYSDKWLMGQYIEWVIVSNISKKALLTMKLLRDENNELVTIAEIKQTNVHCSIKWENKDTQ